MDITSAVAELPALCAGDLSTTPSSGLGTNATVDASQRRAPKAIIIGGGVPAEEVAQLKAAVAAAAPDVATVVVNRSDILAAGGSGPDPELIAQLLKEKLSALGL